MNFTLILEYILKYGYVIHHSNAHFSLGFFANDLLLAVHFISILNYGNDVRLKSKSKWFSYLSSKWDIKQQRQLATSTNLVQELLTNVECSGHFEKQTTALKMRSTVASHWKLTKTNWEPSLKLILLQQHKKLLKNSTATIPWPLVIWNKLERWKIEKWMPH